MHRDSDVLIDKKTSNSCQRQRYTSNILLGAQDSSNFEFVQPLSIAANSGNYKPSLKLASKLFEKRVQPNIYSLTRLQRGALTRASPFLRVCRIYLMPDFIHMCPIVFKGLVFTPIVPKKSTFRNSLHSKMCQFA